MYELDSRDLLDVVESMWHDEVAEMRLLTTLAATAGAKHVLSSTRVFMEDLATAAVDGGTSSADSERAVEAARAAEAAFGGPA